MTTKNTTKSITDFLKARGEVFVLGAESNTRVVEFWIAYDPDCTTEKFISCREGYAEVSTPFTITGRLIGEHGLVTDTWGAVETLAELRGLMKEFTGKHMPKSSHKSLAMKEWQLE